MADDDKTRWAIDVMTAWAQGGDTGFVRDRVDSYLGEPHGCPGLITGLINLSGLLLMGMEATTGKTTPEILQAIASTLSRQGQPPSPS
ncbi:hypothetical protein [Mycolicibacterium sphagni]|uniref:Uncharacterized protein n=1 Tax=Mycolicibacterium sphagni TaxID=1786 RepID=A0A255DFL1_9MYCO|nr:hypothetical protein [Mycolicibacterium sphagni]OYN76025.1 hypothetical protein CG716_23280 [Mycolicibacterium sphagni]